MATKFDTIQVITPLVWKISWCRLRIVGGIRCGLLNDARQILSTNPLSWQRNLIAYNSCCIRDISETLASNRGFSRAGYQMMSDKVVTATIFETKSIITRFVHVYYEI